MWEFHHEVGRARIRFQTFSGRRRRSRPEVVSDTGHVSGQHTLGGGQITITTSRRVPRSGRAPPLALAHRHRLMKRHPGRRIEGGDRSLREPPVIAAKVNDRGEDLFDRGVNFGFLADLGQLSSGSFRLVACARAASKHSATASSRSRQPSSYLSCGYPTTRRIWALRSCGCGQRMPPTS